MAVNNDLPPVPTNADPGGYAWSDWYQKLRTMLNSSVRSFNHRTGAVILTSGDVTTALTYTPYNATNPAGYITSAGAPVQSFNTRTGAISLTSGDVTTALTYTPYNSTNPSGYISSVPWATPGTIGSTTPSTGVFTTLTGTTITGTKFQTSTATVSATTGVATTIITLPNASPAMYLVSANIGSTGDAVNFSAYAVVAADGASTRLVTVNNAALQTITVSGLAIKSTQSSGATQPLTMTVTKIG